MLSNELLEQLHKLTRADKLRIIKTLADDLASEEEATLRSEMTYDVWSPYNSGEAAQILMNMLEEDQNRDD